MTYQNSSPGPESPVTNLQPVTFTEISNVGGTVVYQAVVDDKGAPGAPVYALRISTAVPTSAEEDEELQAILSEMRVGFGLLPEPNPAGDLSGDPDLFNPETQIQIGSGLIEFKGPGPVGVEVKVQTVTGLDTTQTEVGVIKDFFDTVGPAGRDHYWITSGGARNRATVTPQGAYGNIKWFVKNAKGQNVQKLEDVTTGVPATVITNKVIVHGDKRMPYIFIGTFNGPYPMP